MDRCRSVWNRLTISETKAYGLTLLGISIWSMYLIAQYGQADLMVLLDKLMVDDAFYYFKIAANVVSGKGFTFDGLHRTNGFQPLWQFLILPIFAIFKDPLLQIKTVIWVGGALHVVSGLLLFHIFQRLLSGGWALLITYFWTLNHNILKLNLSGMESPVFAVTFLSFILALMKYLDRVGRKRVLLLLGVATAFVSLSRVEASIVFFFAFFLLNLEFRKRRMSLSKSLTALSVYTAGFLVLFGPYLIWNVVYFKTLLPVSGQVKFFYEFGAGWISMATPEQFVMQTLSNVKVFTGHVLDLAFGSFNHYVRTVLFHAFGIAANVDYFRWIYGVVFLAAIGTEVFKRERFNIPDSYKNLAITVAVFSVVHFLFVIILLPHFAMYNIWYYPAILILILSLGIVTWKSITKKVAKCKLIVIFTVVVLILCQGALWKSVKNETEEVPQAVNSFKVTFWEASRWMNQNLPTGTIVGSFSAGVVGFFSRHQVVNLDGFANSKEYLDYLKRGEMRGFVEATGISFIADYFHNDPSKEGINWCGTLAAENMRVVMKWPLPGGASYMVLKYGKE
jgi:hypothetical protein